MRGSSAVELHSTVTRASETSSVAGLGQLLGGGTAAPVNSQFVCPFCGSVNELAEGACPRCTMENTPAGRKATKARIGPWYVLQRRNPAAPGMRFETLLSFVRKGRVKPRSVVRGPTTHQLWRFASQVKGLSREFGLCYSCGGPIQSQAASCPQCNRLQDPPDDADAFLESSADGVGPKTPVAPSASAAIYLEIPAARQEGKNGADGPIDAPAQTESSAQKSAEDEPSSDAPEFEADLIIPAMDPGAPPQEEDDDEQEIVIPVLAANAPPPTGEIIALKGKMNPAPRRKDEGDLTLDHLIPGPAEHLPRRAMGIGHNRLPPSPREPDPDDMGGEEPFPIRRPVLPAPSRRAGVEVGLFILILLGAIVSGLLYVDPQLRQQAMGWISRVRWLQGSFSTDETAAAQSSRRTNLPPMAATRSKIPDESAPATDSSSPGARPHDLPVPSVPAVPTPPLEASAPPLTSAPADEPAAAAAQTADDAVYNHARTLWRAALDAEAAHHYKQAVDLYEQIKKLPRETWPPPLELYLKSARISAASQN